MPFYDPMPNSGTFTVIDKSRQWWNESSGSIDPELYNDFKYDVGDGTAQIAADAGDISIAELAWLQDQPGFNVTTVSYRGSAASAGNG